MLTILFYLFLALKSHDFKGRKQSFFSFIQLIYNDLKIIIN